jgi:hypothetical protein
MNSNLDHVDRLWLYFIFPRIIDFGDTIGGYTGT